MKILLTFIYFLLMSSLVNAEVSCVWGELATSECSCELYKDKMLDASAGDPDAQYVIWQLMTFSSGLGYRSYIPKDEEAHELSKELLQCKQSIHWKERKKLEKQGIEFLKLAANKGHINAQFNLGMHILDEESKYGNNHFSKKGLIACEITKQSGKKESCKYGYWPGNTRKQVDKLRKWANSKRFDNEFSPTIEELVRKAAESGHIHAQFALAFILVHGIGVPIDEVQAQAWRIVAVAQNSPFGANIRDGSLSQRWLTDEEKMEAQAMAEQYMIKYTNLWDKPSMTIIQ